LRSCYHWYNALVTLRTEYQVHVGLGVVAANCSSTPVTDVDGGQVGVIVALAGCRNPDWVARADGSHNAD
jgi:hypothetical protein